MRKGGKAAFLSSENTRTSANGRSVDAGVLSPRVGQRLESSRMCDDGSARSKMVETAVTVAARMKKEGRDEGGDEEGRVGVGGRSRGCYSSFDSSSIYAVKYHLTTRIRLYQLSFLISTIPGPRSRLPALLDLPVI